MYLVIGRNDLKSLVRKNWQRISYKIIINLEIAKNAFKSLVRQIRRRIT